MLQARDLAQRRGHAPGIRFVDGNLIDSDFMRGRWKAAEQRARAFLAVSGAEGHYMDNIALSTLSIFELARDQLEDAVRDADQAIASGRKVRDPQALVPALAFAAFVYAEVADTGRATALLEELEPVAYIASAPDGILRGCATGAVRKSSAPRPARSSATRRGIVLRTPFWMGGGRTPHANTPRWAQRGSQPSPISARPSRIPSRARFSSGARSARPASSAKPRRCSRSPPRPRRLRRAVSSPRRRSPESGAPGCRAPASSTQAR